MIRRLDNLPMRQHTAMRVDDCMLPLVQGAHLRRVAGICIMLVKSMVYALAGTLLGPAVGIGLFLLMNAN